MFKLVWLAVVACHAVNGLYLASVAALYWYITTPDLVYYVPTLNLPPVPIMEVIGATYAVLAFFHAVEIAMALVLSIHRRRLSFSLSALDHANRSTSVVPINSTAPTVDAATPPTGRLQRATQSMLMAYQRWQRLFGIDGQHFETMFELREALEIALQTYQAYYLSRSVSSTWINQLAVATIVVNCFSTPVIHRFVGAKQLSVAATRLLCVVVDSLLDFCNAVLVPLAIFVPYWRAFDATNADFGPDLEYDDAWYTNAVQETRQLFIMSPLDFASTIYPHLTLLLKMLTIKTAVLKRRAGIIVPAASTKPSASLRVHPRSIRYLQLLTCGWGVLVIVAHVVAQRHTHQLVGCRLQNNAWFVTKHACAVLALDCYRLDTSGVAATLDAQLALVDPASLSILGIANCPHLSMPTRLWTFPSLYGLGVFNSTITDWDDPTALDGTALHRLNYLLFVYVNFSDTGTLPLALTQPTLPATLQDMEVFGSNVMALPATVRDCWPHLVTLYMEFTALTSVPRAVFELPQLQFLSLAGNDLVVLPDDAFTVTPSSLRYVTLSSNRRLMALPARASDELVAQLEELHVEYTGITELPDWTWHWLAARETVRVAAGGSPVCEGDARGAASGVAPWQAWQASSRREICSTPAGRQAKGSSPRTQ